MNNTDNKEVKGDRECPSCEQISLVECSSTKWKCLTCEEIFTDEYLDS